MGKISSEQDPKMRVDLNMRRLLESFTAQINVEIALREWIDNALDAALGDFGTQGRVSIVIKLDRKKRQLEITNFGGRAMSTEQLEEFLCFASPSRKNGYAQGQHHMGGTASLLACTHRLHGHLYVQTQEENSNRINSVQIDHLWNQLEVGNSFPISTSTSLPSSHSQTTFLIDGVNLNLFDPEQLARSCDSLGWTYAKLLDEGLLSIRVEDVGNGRAFSHLITPAHVHLKETLLDYTTKVNGFETNFKAYLTDQEAMRIQAVDRALKYGHTATSALRHYTSALIYFNGRLIQTLPLKELPIGITRKGTLDALTVCIDISPNPRLVLKRDILKTKLHSTDPTTTAILDKLTELIGPIVAQLLRDEHRDDELTSKHAQSLEKTLDKAFIALIKLLGDQNSVYSFLGIEPSLRIETFTVGNACEVETKQKRHNHLAKVLPGLHPNNSQPKVISRDIDDSGATLTVSELETQGLPPARIARLGVHKPSVVIDRQHSATISGRGYVDTIYSYAIILNADSPTIKRILDAFGVNPAVNTARVWLVELVLTQLLFEVECSKNGQVSQEGFNNIKSIVNEIIASMD